MARCKLTRMNLRNIRKSREYQALLIDLVATNVVGKSAAEELLGYTIPAGLLSADPVTSDDDDEEQGSSGEGTGSVDVDVTVTPKVTLLNFDNGEWLTAEYDLTDDPSGTGILAFAKDEFDNDALNATFIVEEDPEYVEGESDIDTKYTPLDPQPETLEAGMLIVTFVSTIDTVVPGGN